MKFIDTIVLHFQEEEFIFTASEMEQRIEFAAFTSMLQADWLPCADKWCDFGRNCFYDIEANSLIERWRITEV